MKTKTLTPKNLMALFGVTYMTIYTWGKGTATRDPLPESATPAAVKRWATKHGLSMTCDPATLLGTGIGKPGPKPKVAGARNIAAVRPTSKRLARRTAS